MGVIWIVRELDGKSVVWIQDATDTGTALIEAALAGMEGGTVTDVIALDKARAGRVPKRMVGRALTDWEVAELLKQMG